MNYRDVLKSLFAVPAVVGVLYLAGCDDDPEPVEPQPTDGAMDETMDPGAGPDPSGAGLETEPPAEPASGDFGQTGQGLSDTAKERIEEPLSNLEEALDSAEETTAAEGGTQASVTDRAKEAVDGLRDALDEGSTADISRYVTQLQSMKAQLPANVQQMIDRLAAAVPGVSSIPGAGGTTGDTTGDTTGGDTGAGTTPPDGGGAGGAPPVGDN